MTKYTLQKTQFQKALATLDEAYTVYTESDFEPHEMLRDSVIQRFEYCIDLAWKLIKTELESTHGILVTSPRSAYKEAYAQKIIQDQEIWIDMVETRNMLSHMYREENAERLIKKMKEYHIALNDLLVQKNTSEQ